MHIRSGLRAWSTVTWLLTVALGLSGILAVHDLSNAVAEILRRNDRIARIEGDLNAAFERVHDALLLGIPRTDEESERQLEDSRTRFEAELLEARVFEDTHMAEQLLVGLVDRWEGYKVLITLTLSETSPLAPEAAEQVRSRAIAQAQRMRTLIRGFGSRRRIHYEYAAALLEGRLRSWAVWLACITFLGVVLASRRQRLVADTVIAPLQRIQATIERVAAGDLHLRLPFQREESLQHLALSCNRLLDHTERAMDESRRRIRVERQLTTLLAETDDAPLFVLATSGDMLFCNDAGRRLVETEPGESKDDILVLLRTALRESSDEITFAGVRYRVSAPTPRMVHAPGRVLRLEPGESLPG
jgi:HAMP domain-containing protein